MFDPPPARSRWRPAALLTALLVGCQAYEPAPLDLDAHRAAVATRGPADPALRAFADRLREGDGSAPERFDPTDGVSLEESEVLALFYNPGLRLARLDAGVALATRETAGLWQDPVFGFDAAQVVSPTSLFEFGLTVELTLPVSGRLEVERDRAAAAYDERRLAVIEREWETRMELRDAWHGWSARRRDVELTRRLVERLDQLESIVGRLESAGEMGRTDAMLFRAERLGRIDDLLRLESEAEQARLGLLATMGLSPDATVDLLVRLSPPAGSPAAGEGDGRLLEANPELARRRAAYRVAEEQLRLEIRRQYPDITIGGGYGNEDDDRILMGVSLPIPLSGNRDGIAEARARRELARAEAEAASERLAAALVAARAGLERVRDRRRRIEDDLVPLVDAQADAIDRLTELGEVDMFLLLETVKRRYDASRRLVDLQLDESRAMVRLASLLGPASPANAAPVGAEDGETR